MDFGAATGMAMTTVSRAAELQRTTGELVEKAVKSQRDGQRRPQGNASDLEREMVSSGITGRGGTINKVI